MGFYVVLDSHFMIAFLLHIDVIIKRPFYG